MSSSDSHSELVIALAEEFLERYRKGQQPALREYIDRHPELAAEIKEVFPAMALIENIAVSDESLEDRKTSEVSKTSEVFLQQLGDFRIIREVGRGGMGVVYEAEQVSLGRHVALKVLPQQRLVDPRTKQRFEREARAAAKLHHTNIVPVFGVGEHEGLPYYAMQFIQGMGLDVVLEELKQVKSVGHVSNEPLSGRHVENVPHRDVTAADVARSLLTGQYVPAAGAAREAPAVASDATVDHAAATPAPAQASGLLSDSSSSSSVVLPGSASSPGGKRPSYWQSVAHIGVQVAEALEYAHRQGIQHRDIKPSNLLLDMQGTVWVTDFGLAKTDDQQNLTRVGDVLGTLRYMPPEAFEGKSDARGDIYALGLTLYELAAQRPAFDERDRNKLIKQVTTAEPERLGRVRKGMPRDLATIIHKAIDREPGRRYQKAQDLAEDLRRFLEDRPVKARRVSIVERLVRWAKRRPAAAALLLVSGIAALTAIVGAVSLVDNFQLQEANRHTQHALEGEEQQRKLAQAALAKAEMFRYISNISAATTALKFQDGSAAARALEAAPQEHRNWEWQYLHSQLDGASHTLTVSGGKITSLVLSPSGQQVAVCCADNNEVYLYDVATGKVGAMLRGHSAPATSVAYRPDGQQVATASNDQTIRLWDPATGRQTALLKAKVAPSNLDREPLVAYNSDGSRIASYGDYARDDGGVTSRLWDTTTGKEIAVLAKWQESIHPLAFCPDGRRVAVGSGEFVYLCDAVTGRQLAVMGPDTKPVVYVAYSPEGKRIASAGAEGANALHLWDGESGKEVAVLRAACVEKAHFSADGSRLVSGSVYPDNRARLWDAATGGLLAVLAGHKNGIWGLAFSPDGKRIATSSADQTARLWDGHTGQLLAVLGGHTSRVKHVFFNPSGTRVVTASDDATLRLWDAQTGALIGVLRGHGNALWCPPVFTPDGSRLVSGSDDGTVRIWDMNLVERNGILTGHTSYVYDVAFSPNGEQVASAAWDGTARLWDATTGRQTDLLEHEEKGIITSVAYSRDGRRLATLERKQGVTLWDVASQKAVRNSRFGSLVFWESRACLNPAGTLLALGSAEGPVGLWDVATGGEVARLEGHEKASTDVAFHPEGSLLATAGAEGTVRLWDVATHAPVAVLRGHTDVVWRVAFSADGKLLASGSADKTICLWDVQTHELLKGIPVGSVVYGVAFSPDGTRLAAGCRDNTIRLIDVASRQQVAELRGHSDYVHAVAWSPDGTRLVSGSGDYTARMWDSLSVQERAKREADKAPPH